MKKVEVKICVGTACFVQGGADLLLFNEFIDPYVLEYCNIEGSSCVGECKVEGLGAPYVLVDGVLHSNVSQEKFSKILKEAVDNARVK